MHFNIVLVFRGLPLLCPFNFFIILKLSSAFIYSNVSLSMIIVNYFLAGNKLVMVIFTNIVCHGGKENSIILTDS